MYAWVSGLGLLPRMLLTLQTKDRRSGRVCATILVVVTFQGQRYLVSMLGDGSEWVQNVRAAGGRASIKRGRSRPIQLTELPPGERAPVLKAWSQLATSGRHHLPVSHDAPVSAFEAIAGDYPVFRIDDILRTAPATPGIWHLWVVGVLSLAWNAASCYSQVMVLTHNERYFRAGRMTQEMVEYFTTRPLWYDVAANVSVWVGVVAAIGLLMRKSWTVPLVIVSQAAMILNCMYTLVSADARMALGAGGSIPAIVLIVLGGLLVAYTIRMERRGLLH